MDRALNLHASLQGILYKDKTSNCIQTQVFEQRGKVICGVPSAMSLTNLETGGHTLKVKREVRPISNSSRI